MSEQDKLLTLVELREKLAKLIAESKIQIKRL